MMLIETAASTSEFQVFSKQPIFGLIQDLVRELFFSKLEVESTTGYTFPPCVGSFTFPGIDTR